MSAPPERPPLRVAVAGAGIIARLHLANLALMPGVTVVGVADLDPARAAEAAPPGAAVRADAAELLLLRPEALVVCLPPFARGDVVLRAVEAGVHVFVEKPLALDAAGARALVEAADRAGVVAAVGHVWRHADAARALRDALAGRPHALAGRLLNGPPGPAWSFDQSLSGGLLVEFGTHLFDALRFAGGEVRRVWGAGTALSPDPGGRRGPDTVFLGLEFASGAVGSAQIGWAHPGAAWDVAALTPDGPLLWDLGGEVLDGHVRAASEPPPGGAHGFGGPSWYRGLRDFLDAARDGDPAAPLAPFPEGARNLLLALAARDAVRTGAIVEVERL